VEWEDPREVVPLVTETGVRMVRALETCGEDAEPCPPMAP